MNSRQETIDAMLGTDGQLILTHQPRLPPGPGEVTIRVAGPMRGNGGLADVIRQIAADQRARGFPGRSAAELRVEEEASEAEGADRDRELDAARRVPSPEGP
ncbi:MAG: hypothetical protein A2234_04315 [Elusimicrobia bacterium RIFOXYA2_FULL_58_8]|nr:MAG: hypothetical protein A2234_04315 [Elusimicrobia bacterium RIFOXYA2_FULL_58_8]